MSRPFSLLPIRGDKPLTRLNLAALDFATLSHKERG
jgi:hypothetical protein